MGNAKIPILVAALVVVGFLFRAYPHLLLVDRWIVEEAYNYVTVRDLVASGASTQVGFYPMLEHQLIYWAWLLTHVDPVALSIYANPLLGALTVIPLYYVLRHKLTQNQALLGCGLWALSEAAFYRAAYFGSTEALGFLLSLGALAAYQRKRYILTAPLLVLGALSHLLPTAFIFGVTCADLVLKATNKQRVLIFAVIVAAVALFFSPLNPHQRILASINPASILGKVGTFGIYSLSDVVGGVSMFAGFLILGFVAVYGWLHAQKSRLMFIYLLFAAGLFIFSWVDYQPNIFAPPRLTFYFLVPFIYYAASKLSLRAVWVICAVAVAASWAGCTPMLMTGYAAWDEEYAALDELREMGVIGDTAWWLADYPVTVNMILYTSKVDQWKKTINLGLMVTEAATLKRAATQTVFDPVNNVTRVPFTYPFQYIYLSERMTRGAFFIEQTGGRATRIVRPIEDIWSLDPAWRLIYEGHGVKVYHYEGDK